MPQEIEEGDLIFTFEGEAQVERFDEDQTHGMNHYESGMKRVNFVVTFPNVTWLIEVKDPENTKIPIAHKSKQTEDFREKMRSETLYSDELAPKFKDSLIYLTLANRAPSAKIKYLCCIGLHDLESALLLHMQDRLRKLCFLPGPHRKNWASEFDVVVFNLAKWNEQIPNSTVRRKS